MNELEIGYRVMIKTVIDCGGFLLISYSLVKGGELLYNKYFNKYDYTKQKLENVKKVFDTTIYTKDLEGNRLTPETKKWEKTDYGFIMNCRLPVNMTFDKFSGSLPVIESAIEGQCLAWSDGRNVVIQAMTKKLHKEYKYNKDKIVSALHNHILGISVGETPMGYFTFDLGEKQMNIIVAGYAGSGKSVTLRQIITSLQLAYTPQQVRIILIDLKGGLELSLFEDSPFVEALSVLHEEVLEQIEKISVEMDYRYSIMRQEGVTNITQLDTHIPFKLVFIDEFAEIAPSCLHGDEKNIAKEIENKIGRLLRMGRAAGIYFIFCTQRPDSNIVDGQIKANIQTKICHRVRDKVNSRVVLDNNKAFTLEPYPGRGIFQGPVKIGEEEYNMDMKFQSPYLSPNQARYLCKERFKELSPEGVKKEVQQKLRSVRL